MTRPRLRHRAAVEHELGFTISVLSERSGTSIPTIHHYRRLDLLPEPTLVACNRFLYDERHVQALTVIRLLREEQQLPLETIRVLLPGLMALAHDESVKPDVLAETIAAHLEEVRDSMPEARLVAAARREFALHGFAGANVEEICAAAGVAKGSFYRYFDSKDDIFVAAARSTVEAVGEELDDIPAPMSETQAVEKLQLLLGPLAPLLLEVAVGELRHQANLMGVASAIAQGLAMRVMPRLAPRTRSAARRVVDKALSGLLRPALEAVPSRPPRS